MAYCRKCGHPLEPSMKRCPKCGSSNPDFAKKKNKGAGNLLYFLLGIMLSAGILAGVMASGWLTTGKKESKPTTVEGKGYDSAEEAIKAYAQYLKEGNLDGLLSTCAIESYSSHLQATAYFELYRSYTTQNSLPPGSDLRNRIDEEQQRGLFMEALRKAYMQYAIKGTDYEEPMNTMYVIPIEKGDENRFAETIKNNEIPLAAMEIGEIIPFENMVEMNANYVRIVARYLSFLGAQDLKPQLLQVTLQGEPYIIATTTVCYNGKWYNLAPRAYFAGLQDHIAPLSKWQEIG